MKFYYLTLFKIEGHTTFRAHISKQEGGFTHEVNTTPNFPKITEKKVLRIDALTAEIEIK